MKIDQKGNLALSEKDVTKQVRDYLEAHGWRGIRMNSGAIQKGKRYVQFGELGIPDWVFLQSVNHPGDLPTPHYRQHQYVMWIEFKAPGGKLSAIQKRWHEQETRRGGLVLVVDDFEKFQEFYENEL